MIREKAASRLSGSFMVPVLFVLLVLATTWLLRAAIAGAGWVPITAAALLWAVTTTCAFGLTIVNPNEARVLLLFGSYAGTLHDPGFWWVHPFALRPRVSLRVRNFESARLKVNDHAGNPIEIAAVVVWRVTDTAEAMFEVDDYKNFLQVQTEAAVRNLATGYPYDSHVEGEIALRSHTAEIAAQMKTEIQERLTKAGIEVIEARISHLAYAPEIAGAMLRRQQASAIVAARQKIVEGAVGMVEMALDQLSRRNVVALDDERKAAMVSNMLVVLCSDQHTQPVVNTGSLYH